ncbi:MAG: TonB-dependent receptor plug domain-containing protein [Rhodanobacteraceae bacterium]
MSGITHRKHGSGRSSRGPLALSTFMTGIALGLPPLATAAAPIPAVDASGTPTQLPAITVTAQKDPYKIDQMQSPKFTEPLLDTPQTIDVISMAIIQQQGATTLTEALQNSPGVGTFFVGENGSTSTGDAIYMRGFDAAGSIFVDGVRDLGAISRDVFDTDQVEVIKGPDGTVYGRTTPTGAINMVSKQPMLDNGATASVAYGSAD